MIPFFQLRHRHAIAGCNAPKIIATFDLIGLAHFRTAVLDILDNLGADKFAGFVIVERVSVCRKESIP